MADWLIEHTTGWTLSFCRMYPETSIPTSLCERIDQYLSELLQWRPIQYVMGEAWFHGMKFRVDERVLIPRPETEELVDWVAESYRLSGSDLKATRILDIGTGSGCIAISLKKKMPQALIWGLDVSPGALEVAVFNASSLMADVSWILADVLDPAATHQIPEVDIIVSNPPYVLHDDRLDMRRNVLDWEPHTALFVDGPDPLRFYRRIADLGLAKLPAGGEIFFEIHEAKSGEVIDLLLERGYKEPEARRDMTGRDRMVRARKA